MQATIQHDQLVQLMAWIDQHTSGLCFPTDDGTMLSLRIFRHRHRTSGRHRAAFGCLAVRFGFCNAPGIGRVISQRAMVTQLWHRR